MLSARRAASRLHDRESCGRRIPLIDHLALKEACRLESDAFAELKDELLEELERELEAEARHYRPSHAEHAHHL
jgi:hypothetical protein